MLRLKIQGPYAWLESKGDSLYFYGRTKNKQRVFGLLFDKCDWKFGMWDMEYGNVVLTTDSDSLFRAAQATIAIHVTEDLLEKLKGVSIDAAADLLASKMLLKR